MTAEEAVGKIATFYGRSGDVVGCLPVAGAVQHVGQVEFARSTPNARGDIPDMILKIRGRSGKVASVTLVDHHVRFFSTWADALEAIK